MIKDRKVSDKKDPELTVEEIVQEVTKLNLHQKIIEVRKLVKFLRKDTKGYQYNYVSGSSVLYAIREKMDDLGLILKTDIYESSCDLVEIRSAKKIIYEFVSNLKMKMTWIDAEDPNQRLECLWTASGQDADPSKAIGKAHTYGERYYLLKFFLIPTDDEDPDSFQKKHEKPTVDKVQPVDSFIKKLRDQAIDKAKSKFKGEGADLNFKNWCKEMNLTNSVGKADQSQLEQLIKELDNVA